MTNITLLIVGVASMVVLFGVRSAIVVEYEETCHRLGLTISAAVSLKPNPRVFDRSTLVDIADFKGSDDGFYACAFFPGTRRGYFERAEALGMAPADPLVDPNAIIARNVRIGDASFLNAAAVVGAVSMIGDGVLINRGVTIGHHCIIGDFVSIGPGANLASNIHVGEGSIIGAGATILPDVRIGENCIVAGGSVVRKNVPDDTFVVGAPAKPRPFDAKASSLFVEDGE